MTFDHDRTPESGSRISIICLKSDLQDAYAQEFALQLLHSSVWRLSRESVVPKTSKIRVTPYLLLKQEIKTTQEGPCDPFSATDDPGEALAEDQYYSKR
jgi:hypothetical protein